MRARHGKARLGIVTLWALLVGGHSVLNGAWFGWLATRQTIDIRGVGYMLADVPP